MKNSLSDPTKQFDLLTINETLGYYCGRIFVSFTFRKTEQGYKVTIISNKQGINEYLQIEAPTKAAMSYILWHAVRGYRSTAGKWRVSRY